MSTIENLSHKVTIDKLGEGVFLHKKHKDKDDGFIFTKGFGVVNEEYIWFYTPDGKVQGKHRIADTYVDGVVYPDKDALSLKLKEIGHIIYDVTAAAPADYTDVLNSILEAVDGLELNTENINLNAEQINLNTDEVEELLTDIKNLLTADTIGESCATPSFTKDCDRAELLDKLDEVIEKIKESLAENTTDILTSLSAIKLTLEDIEENTATSNTNEALIITELETANTTLTSILDEENKSLVYSSSTNICVDGVNHLVRVKSIWDNETGTSVTDTVEFSIDGSTWTSTVPTGTISLGFCSTTDETLTTFQVKDCDGNDVGDEVSVHQTVVLNKVITSICNTADIVDPIVDKLDELVVLQTPDIVENKSYQILAGQTITFSTNKVYQWVAGVYNGQATYTEGGSSIGTYEQGDSFGNGDQTNKIKNINAVVISALTNGDVRISVMQEQGYNPTIS
jgi:hypothetical protein